MSDAAPNPPDDTATPNPSEDGDRRFELLAALLLGVAAILTAISAYKAALLDGDALKGYTQSTRILSDSNTFYAQSNQTFTQDQQLFVQYATAKQSDNAELATYLHDQLMRPELTKAIDWWESEDGALTPFDEAAGNPYTLADTTEAERLEKQAATTFNAAADADDEGDKYELASVLLAITLFFGGIATLFKRRPTKIGMLGVSTVSLGIGAFAVAQAYFG